MGFAIGHDEKYLSDSFVIYSITAYGRLSEKYSYRICDVWVKNSCEICELIFPLGQRCRKEMVRACSQWNIYVMGPFEGLEACSFGPKWSYAKQTQRPRGPRLAPRLRGIKQKKIIIHASPSMRFLLFYSPKPRSQVRILIYRNWANATKKGKKRKLDLNLRSIWPFFKLFLHRALRFVIGYS